MYTKYTGFAFFRSERGCKERMIMCLADRQRMIESKRIGSDRIRMVGKDRMVRREGRLHWKIGMEGLGDDLRFAVLHVAVHDTKNNEKGFC